MAEVPLVQTEALSQQVGLRRLPPEESELGVCIGRVQIASGSAATPMEHGSVEGSAVQAH